MFSMSPQRVLPAILFAAMLLAGIASYRDYGISWDEPNMQRVGTEAYNTVFRGQPWPEGENQRFYGTTIELPLHAIQERSGATDPASIFAQRRFFSFLIFLGGVFFFYLLVTYHFKSWELGLLGATMLFLSPRIFAHAFYNTRDIPALVLFTLCAYTLVRLLDRRSLTWAAIHGFATALLVTSRITGLFMALFTGLFLLWQMFQEWRAERTVKSTVTLGVAYAVASIILTVALWPLLWNDPLRNFLAAYRWSSGLSSGGFYLGEWMQSFAWHYVPVWVLITTPPLYTLAFFVGCASLVVWLTQNGWRKQPTQGRHWFLFTFWMLMPVLFVIVTGKGVHDDYRHLYFVYPAFLLFALEGIRRALVFLGSLGNQRVASRAPGILLGFIALCLGVTAYGMVRMHPLQNLYFSIPARYVEGNFEMDYWGLSFRKGFEYVLENDTRPTIRIHPTSSPGWSTVFVLPPEQRSRVQLVDVAEAEYVIDNFRDHDYAPSFPSDKEVYAVMVNGLKVLGVYRMR